MFKSLLLVRCILILLIFASPSYGLDLYSMADQSTWRCPGGVVSIGDSDRAILEKCGNPIDVARVQDFGPIWIYQLVRPALCTTLRFKMESCSASPAPHAEIMIPSVTI